MVCILLAVGGPLALGRGAIRQDDCWLKWGRPSLVQCNCDTNKFYTDVFCQRPEVIYQETLIKIGLQYIGAFGQNNFKLYMFKCFKI